MTLDSVIEFMKQNLTGPQDMSKCQDYIGTLQLSGNDLEYAHGMLSRWVEAGRFKKDAPFGHTWDAAGAGKAHVSARLVYDFAQENQQLFSEEERRDVAISALQEWLCAKNKE